MFTGGGGKPKPIKHDEYEYYEEEEDNPLATILKLNLTSGSWTKVGNMTRAREDPAASVVMWRMVSSTSGVSAADSGYVANFFEYGGILGGVTSGVLVDLGLGGGLGEYSTVQYSTVQYSTVQWTSGWAGGSVRRRVSYHDLMPVSAVCAVSLVLAIPTMLCYQTLAGDW